MEEKSRSKEGKKIYGHIQQGRFCGVFVRWLGSVVEHSAGWARLRDNE
jgi:hypothetical protein